MNCPHMFPGFAVSFALGLNNIAVAILRMVPGMYSSSAGDLNRTSCPGGSSDRAPALCTLLNWSHWACFLEIKKFLIFYRLTG